MITEAPGSSGSSRRKLRARPELLAPDHHGGSSGSSEAPGSSAPDPLFLRPVKLSFFLPQTVATTTTPSPTPETEETKNLRKAAVAGNQTAVQEMAKRAIPMKEPSGAPEETKPPTTVPGEETTTTTTTAPEDVEGAARSLRNLWFFSKKSAQTVMSAFF